MNTALSFAVKDEEPPHLGMAPLVDIVLLLICFYLFVMQSIQSQAEETIDLPQLSSERTYDLMPAELTINLGGDGRLSLNGAEVDDADLADLLSSEHAEALGSDRRLVVVIRADRRQPFERLDTVLAACREAGLSAASIRSVRGVGP